MIPESISEGGFQIIGGKDNIFGDQNGRNYTYYKSMRCRIQYQSSSKWPWISNNVIAEWSTSNDILYYANTKIETFLKAFEYAPVWTSDELDIFKECLVEFGANVTKMPKPKTLIYKKMI